MYLLSIFSFYTTKVKLSIAILIKLMHTNIEIIIGMEVDSIRFSDECVSIVFFSPSQKRSDPEKVF